MPAQSLRVEAGGAGVWALPPTLQFLGAAECLLLSQQGRDPLPLQQTDSLLSMFSKVPHPVSSEEGCWTGTESPLGTWPDFPLAAATPRRPWEASSSPTSLPGRDPGPRPCFPLHLRRRQSDSAEANSQSRGPTGPSLGSKRTGGVILLWPLHQKCQRTGGLGHVCQWVLAHRAEPRGTRALASLRLVAPHPNHDGSGFRLVQGCSVHQRWESRGS